MAKKIYILLFVVIGLIMGPQSAMARHVEEAKVCCQKMSPKKTCCKQSTDERPKKQLSCKGSCGSCSCVHYVDVKTPLLTPVMDKVVTVALSEKQKKYYYLELFHANVSREIWLPPKIS